MVLLSLAFALTVTHFWSHYQLRLGIVQATLVTNLGNQPNLTIKLKIFIGQFQSANQSAAGGKVPHPKRLGRVVGQYQIRAQPTRDIVQQCSFLSDSLIGQMCCLLVISWCYVVDNLMS